MPPRVFISHSTKDKQIADAICRRLESEGIECWIAPRDIEVGSEWSEAIMRGIETCRAFILVLSANANHSEHVSREVAKAFSLKLAVIPFRTEPVMPNRSLGYFLETVQWLDAISPPLEKHLGILVERVKQVPADGSASTAGAPAITPDRKAQPKQSAVSNRKLWIGRVGLATAAIVIATAVWLFPTPNQSEKRTSASQKITAASGKTIGIYYGQMKLDPHWEPLRKDPRYDQLLTELTPKE
jgi:hypothetical protein